jgi:hypothetical protein
MSISFTQLYNLKKYMSICIFFAQGTKHVLFSISFYTAKNLFLKQICFSNLLFILGYRPKVWDLHK